MNKKIIVVLSGGVDKINYNEPNAWSKKRYDIAIELYQRNPTETIIISTTDRSYRLQELEKTEAQIGKDYMVNKSKKTIQEKDIILEENSKDTLSNALYARKIIEELDTKQFTVITSKFMLQKTEYLFKEIVFPQNQGWEIQIIATENEGINEESLQARVVSEEMVINFYKTHLEKTFNVIPGDINSIEEYITQISKAYNPKTTEKHQRNLTEKIEIATKNNNNPLY
jgi:vancomycin permeability regulator SanA